MEINVTHQQNSLQRIPNAVRSLAVPVLLLATSFAPALSGCGPQLDPLDPEEIVSEATIEPMAFSTWVRHARIGGASVRMGMSQSEMDQLMSNLSSQGVSVVEADFEEGLSNYRTEAQFDQFLPSMRALAATAHSHGLKIVLYYASLEVLTPNGANLTHTMAKDHPSWVQVGIDGKKNVGYGGSPTTPWVEPGMEDAWMSPSSPYRDIYIGRAARIALTGMDGLWVDVPLYAAWGTTLWNDVSPYAAQKFRSDTGYTAPDAEDWSDRAWRRFIAWRHQELRGFISDVAKATRPTPDSEFVVIVETLPTSGTGSTIWGLEGAMLRAISGVTSVWEVSTLSVNSSMRTAREDDWICYISMHKYIRAATGSKPSWAFAYAKQPDDAEFTAGEVLAARNNVYELKQPEMASTIGVPYRKNLFGWIEKNEAALFDSTPAARVGIYYSPPSRDYVDRSSSTGQYVTTNSADDTYWESHPSGSAYNLKYVAEFRGMVKLLVQHHIPFEVVVRPTSPSDLARFQVVLAPDPEALPAAEVRHLRSYVQDGGNLIVTGPNPGGWDGYGGSRQEYQLAEVLGIHKDSPLPASSVQRYGAGQGRYFSARLGREYFIYSSEASAAAVALLGAIDATSTPWLTTTASSQVHIELTQSGNKMFLHYVNFIGFDGTFSVVSTNAPTTFKTPAGYRVVAVEITTLDGDLQPLAFTRSGQEVSFTVPVDKYAVVVLTLRDGASDPQATYVPQEVTTLTGRPDYGNAASLGARDASTYDIESAFVAAEGGGVTDWYAQATISEMPSAVSRIVTTYAGQFSIPGVSQQLYLYNFRSGAWDLFDTRTVGNTVDVTVTAVVSAQAADYVSSEGELRVRVRGVRSGGDGFYSWANSLSWETS